MPSEGLNRLMSFATTAGYTYCTKNTLNEKSTIIKETDGKHKRTGMERNRGGERQHVLVGE